MKNLKNGLLFIKFYAIINFVPGCGSAWLERRLREAEVASSNPATPIVKSLIFKDFIFCVAFHVASYNFSYLHLCSFGVPCPFDSLFASEIVEKI